MNMDSISLRLCGIQGRLFELSRKKGCQSDEFVSYFMKSEVAGALDSVYNRMQWAGEEYLLEEVLSESKGKIKCPGDAASHDMMYWTGYIYRYWHFYKNERSSVIYRQADFKTMERNYLMFHTMDPELAIDCLIEIRRQRNLYRDEGRRRV